ncbi:MAG TPA: RidA family protein, partial [Blastocatellia bacterium]
MLVENKRGSYSFLKGIAPYSAGVVADAGFEVVHVRLPRYVPLRAGFDVVEEHLKRAGRPLRAVCGMELRSPKPFSFTGFNQFNAGYVDVLKNWDIFVDGMNPVARTNIAPEVNPPPEPSLYGFSY